MESIVDKILYARYRIIRELSQSEFSKLYLAEDIKAKVSQCQIERLKPNYRSEVLGEQSWRKILREFDDRCTILKNISQHPQIPQLLAFFECDREFYLVRELIPGESLEQQLQSQKISEAEAYEWLQEILGILEFVHQAGVMHLNIQPTSLIQARDGKKFLANFASITSSVLFDDKSELTTANQSFSAEVNHQESPSFASDIYALGKTIIYALTYNLTEFIRAEPSVTADDSLSEEVVTAAIKPELADILNKMVDRNQVRRYQSASEVLSELNFEPQNLVAFPPPLLPSNRPRFTPKKQPKASVKEKRKSPKRLIWLLLSLPFITALAIVFVGLNKDTYADFTDYSNSSYQFELKYPQIWDRKDIDDPITGEVVSFTSPLESSTDLFREKLYITVEYLPSDSATLEEYSQTVIKRIEQTKDNELQVYKEGRTKVEDSPARAIVYSRQQGEIKLRQMEVFTIKNDRVYVAIYTAERAKYSKFLDTAEKIIDSWKIE